MQKSGGQYTLLLVGLLLLTGACGSLTRTPDIYRGTTYQRYVESPGEVQDALIKVIEERQSPGWSVTDTIPGDDVIKLETDFARLPVTNKEHADSLKLIARIL